MIDSFLTLFFRLLHSQKPWKKKFTFGNSWTFLTSSLIRCSRNFQSSSSFNSLFFNSSISSFSFTLFLNSPFSSLSFSFGCMGIFVDSSYILNKSYFYNGIALLKKSQCFNENQRTMIFHNLTYFLCLINSKKCFSVILAKLSRDKLSIFNQ